MDDNLKFSLNNILRDSSFDYISALNSQDPDSNNFEFSDSPYDNSSINCTYIDENKIISSPSSPNDLTIISINIQSITSKFSEFSQLINNLNAHNAAPDVICLQELWNFPPDAAFNLNGYHPLVFSLRHNNVQGGGVGIYIKTKFTFNLMPEYSIFVDRIFESIVVEIKVNPSTKIYVASMYRPGTNHPTLSPADLFQQFIELFSNFCSTLISTGNIYLLGDINLDLLKYSKCSQVSTYVDLLFSFGLLQIITKPTRCTSKSATLIDHIVTNVINSDLNSAILISYLSDHFPVLHTIKAIAPVQTPKFIESRNFSKNNLTKFNVALLHFDWNNVLKSNDTQISYNNFSDSFFALYDLYFPTKKIRFNKKYHKIEKWMSFGLLTSRCEKIRLSKLCFTHPTPSNVSTYKKYRNLFNTLIRAAKKQFYDKLFQKFQSNLSKTWQLINEVINKKPKKNSQTFTHLLINNLKVEDPFDIANEFNEFFTTIAQKISDDVIPTDKPPDHSPPTPNDTLFSLKKEPVTHSEVYDAINMLQKKKTSDMFGVSVFFIAKFALTLSKPLRHIFSLSFNNGVVPQQFKIAKVVPIHKSGVKDQMDNYRPISLLCTFSKILEKIMYNRLSNFLETNNLLSPQQFGFRKSHSTVHPLTLFVNQISNALNKKTHAIAIFCDIKKAFDTVQHPILLKKLYNMGIRGTELLWFQDYLCNRKQYVSVNGVNSYLRNILFGVPQGSILGPILFLIYINDLPKCSSLFTSLFADDTKLVATGPDLPLLIQQVNCEFQKINYFFRSLKLSLHPSKTKFMIFTNNTALKHLDLKIYLNNNNFDQNNPDLLIPIEQINSLSPVPAIKFLGIFIDPELNFKFHIAHLTSKISKALYFIRNSKNILSEWGLKCLYYSLVHCHLVYANIIWCSAKESSLKPLFLKQKAAVRIVSSSPYNAHTEPIFKSLKILPFPKLTEFFKLQFFHQFKQGLLPSALKNLWSTNSELNPDRLYRLRNDDDIRSASSRLNQFNNFPLYSIPPLWSAFNEEDIKIQRNTVLFNSLLKKYFLSKLNESYQCSRLLCPHCHLNLN